MHGLATGSESRQQLYTMMTRGAHANHVYLEVVGDGDPHSVINPTLVRPLTPTDIPESMLARDDTQRSGAHLLPEGAYPSPPHGEASHIVRARRGGRGWKHGKSSVGSVAHTNKT